MLGRIAHHIKEILETCAMCVGFFMVVTALSLIAGGSICAVTFFVTKAYMWMVL
jgi:hypothetical protein